MAYIIFNIFKTIHSNTQNNNTALRLLWRPTRLAAHLSFLIFTFTTQTTTNTNPILSFKIQTDPSLFPFHKPGPSPLLLLPSRPNPFLPCFTKQSKQQQHPNTTIADGDDNNNNNYNQQQKITTTTANNNS